MTNRPAVIEKGLFAAVAVLALLGAPPGALAQSAPREVQLYLSSQRFSGDATRYALTTTPSTFPAFSSDTTWVSETATVGDFTKNGRFLLSMPCAAAMHAGGQVTLSAVPPGGGAPVVLGSARFPALFCVGDEQLAIPVAVPLALATHRLQIALTGQIAPVSPPGRPATLTMTDFSGAL